MSDVKLKLCPFCGSSAEIRWEEYDYLTTTGGWSVQCQDDVCKVKVEGATEKACVKNWNKRKV